MVTPTTPIPFENQTTDRLALTLFLATALHALIILSVTFGTEDRPEPENDPTPSLDVTVVKAKPAEAPQEYDYLADSSQDGGGNTDQRVAPQQQQVVQTPPPAAADTAQPNRTQVLTRDESRTRVEKPEETPPERQAPKQPGASELINRTMEMVTLNQQINQSLQIYSKTPRSKFISARTKEVRYASYMRDWVTKVERVGELNYPDAARRQNLSGKLIVQVAIYPDGSVRDITIRKPSGHKILDDAAVRIVKLAAPFAPLPENIRKDTDVLYITRTWVFTSGNRLKSH